MDYIYPRAQCKQHRRENKFISFIIGLFGPCLNKIFLQNSVVSLLLRFFPSMACEESNIFFFYPQTVSISPKCRGVRTTLLVFILGLLYSLNKIKNYYTAVLYLFLHHFRSVVFKKFNFFFQTACEQILSANFCEQFYR